MSYDIYIRSKWFCPHCGRDSQRDSDTYSGDLPSPTYNLTPIFDLALTGEPLPNPDVPEAAVVLLRTETDRPRGLRILSGRKVAESIPMIENALKRIQSDEVPYKKLEPSNGWGTLKDAVWVFEEMLGAAKKCNPEAVWEIR